MLGVLVPCSQYLTARGVTPTAAASAACVMPCSVRKLRSFLSSIVYALLIIDIKRDCTAVESDLILCGAVIALHLFDFLDGVKLNRKAGQRKTAERVVDNGYTFVVTVAGERVGAKTERIGGEDGGQCAACVVDGVDKIGEGNKHTHDINLF